MVADGRLYAHITESLRLEPQLDASRITLSVRSGGVVILGGIVSSYMEKHLAERIIEKIESVRGIVNEVSVRIDDPYRRPDVDIAIAALNAINATMFIPHDEIKVTVDNGHMILSGEVSLPHQKEKAHEVVRELYGVTHVTNNIHVKPQINEREINDAITFELSHHHASDIENIEINVDGSQVTLKGKVKSLDDACNIIDLVWSVPGVMSVVDLLYVDV